jgi:hypothetical protein
MKEKKIKFLKVTLFCFLILINISLIAAPRLPIINGDDSTWGSILNEYITTLAGDNATSLNRTMVNGTNIYESSINTTHIADSTISSADLGANSVTSDKIDYSTVTVSDFTNDANYLSKDEGGVINGDLIVNGNFSLIGSYLNATVINQYLNGSFFPSITNLFDIGSELLSWRNLYLTGDAFINGTLYVAGVNISENNNSISNYIASNNQSMNDYIEDVNSSMKNYVDYVNSTNSGNSYDNSWINETIYSKIDINNFNTSYTNTTNTSYVPYTGADKNFDLGNNNLTIDTNTLFVDSVNNRVGIGTTSPGAKLDVYNNAQNGIASGIRVINPNAGTDAYASIDYINDRGGTGFQTGLYSSKVGASANDAFFYNGVTGGGIGLWTGGANRLYVKSDGNVGIGTTSPQQKLHVNGSILSNGTINATTDVCIQDGMCLSQWNATNTSYLEVSQWNATNTSYALDSVLMNGSFFNVPGEDTFVSNYSTFLTHISWATAMNGTLAKSSELDNGSYFNVAETDSLAYNGTLLLTSQWNATNTSYIPYTGATGNIDLGNNNLTLSNHLIISNGTSTTAHWNMYEDENGTLVWEQL